MSSFVSAAMALVLGVDPSPEIHQDFRDGGVSAGELRLVGKNASQYVTCGPEGLCISLPTRSLPVAPVGVTYAVALQADFEITISYEIVSFTPPSLGKGVGVRLQILAGSDREDAAALARAVHPVEGDVFATTRASKKTAGSRRHRGRQVPASVKRGKLRLVRHAADIVYLATTTEGEEFEELRRERNVDDVITTVRVVGYTGGSTSAFKATSSRPRPSSSSLSGRRSRSSRSREPGPQYKNSST